MMLYIAIIAVVSFICIVFLLLIRRNKNKLKRKIEYGKAIYAKVISWTSIPGKPTRYAVKVDYEIDGEKKNKMLITSGKFAKKYEYEKNIQIVVVPDSNEVFFEEEDWKSSNMILLVFLFFDIYFLIQLLLMGFIKMLCP
ncbi:MAG: hypothetical protein HDR23_04740 [Lachnospiraceae bacterium]|nr:hypothetical protein [Lachnospiraceae bacterium]